MLTGGGLACAMELKEMGKRVFLDMKLFDISNTVEAAVSGLAQFDLDFLTVHGDPHVVRAATRARGDSDLKILAVTILTSLDRSDLDESMIVDGEPQSLVVERARRAMEAGADGVIASPQEAAMIRDLRQANGKLIVTPGVRPQGTDVGDQKRVTTPYQAIKDGADHIVVGRPVVRAPDPLAAVRAIVEDMNQS